VLPNSVETGVAQEEGREVEPLSSVRGSDARSTDIRSPDGVTRSFQVSVYNVEPSEAIRARNLFPKDDRRAALLDESEPRGPEVSFVVGAASLAGHRERLTGTASGPHGEIVGPSSETQGAAPSTDAGEEMSLHVIFDVASREIT
jgi:hypothetical protein